MREIKFRGLRNGEWVYGDLSQTYPKDFKPQITEWTEKEGGYYATYPVRKETVGQFVGLLDKNGKEIYEGDIVKAVWYNSYGTEKSTTGEVRFNQLECHFDIGAKHWLKAFGKHLEIVGNIYENTELLRSEIK